MGFFRVQGVPKTLSGPVFYKTSGKNLSPPREPQYPPRGRLKKVKEVKNSLLPQKIFQWKKGPLFWFKFDQKNYISKGSKAINVIGSLLETATFCLI